MEVNEVPDTASDSKKVKTQDTTDSVNVCLHPLVVMNISEHWTRLRVQEGTPQKVIGAVIGKHEGRNMAIMNSFELLFACVGGDIIIDTEYYKHKAEQFKQIFSDMEFLGWYTSGKHPDENDVKIHTQICGISENAIFRMFDPQATCFDTLPVTIYESAIGFDGTRASLLFDELDYTVAIEEAERIGVNHISNMTSNEAEENSSAFKHLIAQHSAIKILYSQVQVVLGYLRAVRDGILPPNRELLREVNKISHQLPAFRGEHLQQALNSQCIDAGMIAYLCAITKICNDSNSFIDKFKVRYDGRGNQY